MPKEVFLKLPTEKQKRILSVLETEFKTQPFPKVNVKEIVEKLGIAHGSFYQYLENLEKIQFIKAVVHNLIERMFREEWTKEAFIANYKQHWNWIEKGVTYGTR